MVKKTKQRTYDSNFIEDAVNLALSKQKSVSKQASDLGVPVGTLHTWIAKSKAGKLNATRFGSAVTKSNSDSRKVAELEKQVRLLKMERDILKKAMAYWVDVPK